MRELEDEEFSPTETFWIVKALYHYRARLTKLREDSELRRLVPVQVYDGVDSEVAQIDAMMRVIIPEKPFRYRRTNERLRKPIISAVKLLRNDVKCKKPIPATLKLNDEAEALRQLSGILTRLRESIET